MREALETLDAGMPANRLVRISRKRQKDGWIAVTPFDPQPEPPSLTAIKADIAATWPMTSLLDMLKEADLRLNLTDVLKSATAYEFLGSLCSAPAALALPERARNECWVSAHGRAPIRHDSQGSRLCPAPIYHGRCAAAGHCHCHQRHAARPQSEGSGVTGQRPAHLIPSTSEPGTRTSLRNGTSDTEDAVS